MLGFFVWQLVTAFAITAAAAALSALVIGSGFVRTFDVALCLVGGVLLIFGAGAMTFQITGADRPTTGTRGDHVRIAARDSAE